MKVFPEKPYLNVWGDPKYEIVAETEEGKYDLVVIGSRGLSGIKAQIF